VKSPAELAARLARQWQNTDLREQRLLNPASWPLRLTIGKPGGADIRHRLDQVREHIRQWRNLQVGRVEWQSSRFQSASESIAIPVAWVLASPSEWIKAADSADIRREYQMLSRLASRLDSRFHSLIIRRQRLVIDKPDADIIRCGKLAEQITPGCADGKPLRAISLAGIDSKFFERNRQLVIKMLDVLYAGQASELGLEAFLGAEDEGHHWLLVADLDGQLLPFSQLRVRASELQEMALPGQRLLLVENERCLHQLPDQPGTVAVLGAGLNLAWLKAHWLADRTVGYWGDLDTWGLVMLGRARGYLPHLTALLMYQATFEKFQEKHAVTEPQPASSTPPGGLTYEEAELYIQLLQAKRGRLEQEFLPKEDIHQAVREWARTDTLRNV